MATNPVNKTSLRILLNEQYSDITINAEYQNGKLASDTSIVVSTFTPANASATNADSITRPLAARASGLTTTVSATRGIQATVITYKTLVNGIIKKLPITATGEIVEKNRQFKGIIETVIEQLSATASPTLLNFLTPSNGFLKSGYNRYAPKTAP